MSSKPHNSDHPTRFPRLLGTPRRRVLTGGLAVVVAAGVVLVATDPFGSSTPSSAGVSDNAYPTSTTTVKEQDLSSQTSVSATLGYAGTYTVSLPSGTAAATVTGDEQTVATDQTKVANDKTALVAAKVSATPTNHSTLLAAEQTVSADEAAVKAAKLQLASDEQLGCPASSSSTVTTAIGGSSPSSGSSSPSASTSSSSSSSSSPSSTGSSSSGNTGTGSKAHLTALVMPAVATASAPSASTGTIDNTTNTSTTVMGTVNPGGADTTYFFQYGTSANYGQSTASSDAGSGSVDVAASATLSGLTPGATYHYRLVAKNSDGTDYGQDGTFTTNAAPLATTGSATPISATAESLGGTVTSNGADTTYYFEWGTSSSFGHTTPITDAGAGASAASETATITGLTPGVTYDFALVAQSALGTSTGQTVQFQAAASSCVAERQVITEDETALTEAKDELQIDRLGAGSTVATAQQTLTSDEATLAAAKSALASDQSNAANPNTTFTSVPIAGKVISRGQSVYALDGQPVPLLYGTTTLYRALYLGVSNGPDVLELEQNLGALGFEQSGASAHFSAATESAVEAWQRVLGVPATGIVALGDVVVEPGPIDVNTVTATSGSQASAGTAVLTATSTTREVTISLSADQQSEVKVGDPVVVTLPDSSTTPGVVSSVGTVATVPSSSNQGGGSSTPTITVEVTLSDPKATGDLVQAPVQVAITNGSVKDALVVPVDALLALSSGGYAIEEVGSGVSHHLVSVSLGLFDDADGLVQVTGSGVAAGQKVVVPNT